MSDLRTILEEGLSPDSSLNSMFEIENVLLLINEMNHKIDYYKGLKQHRIQAIDAKVGNLTAKVGALRNIVLNTMKSVAPNDKTIDFPSIGKVSRRKAKDALVIDDQDAVIEFLELKGEKENIVRQTETVDKRKLNIIVSRLKEVGESVPGTSVSAGSESLSISFEKHEEDSMTTIAAPSEEINLDHLDALIV